MNNVILGLGLIGRIACNLHPDWVVAPFGGSRFYTFDPPLAENHIVVSDKISDYLGSLGYNLDVDFYKKSYSICGELLNEPQKSIIEEYVEKVYNTDSDLMALLLERNISSYYKNIKANELYKNFISRGFNNKVIEIKSIDSNNRLINTSGGVIEYNKIISTIPLNVLSKLLNLENDFKAKDVYIYDITTPSLDFEGANEVLVVDKHIDFYRTQKISDARYIFYSFQRLNSEYFGAFMNQFAILGETVVEEYVPIGDIPKLDDLEKVGIECVGSMARWDDFCDISTSIAKLLTI